MPIGIFSGRVLKGAKSNIKVLTDTHTLEVVNESKYMG